MKNIRNFAFLILVVVAAVGANAQTTLSGKVQFPSDVRWGKAVLPAGEYSLSIPSAERPVRVFIRSMDGKTAAMAQAEIIADPQPGGSYILTTGSGSDQLVRSMNLPQLGFSLVYAPLTARERETLYASTSHTLPMQTAGQYSWFASEKLSIPVQRRGALFFLDIFTSTGSGRRMHSMLRAQPSSMGKVQVGYVHADAKQVAHGGFGVAGWTDGADDFRAPDGGGRGR